MAREKNLVLVVDLDGTLLRSDMLFESFWSAFGLDWRSPFLSVAALTGGRASLKRHLAVASAVEAATLPYDPKVIAFVQEWRASGGRTALVTASDRDFAEAIASHVGIFDEVHGSDGKLNLEGEHKGQFLEEWFGSKGFAYKSQLSSASPFTAQDTAEGSNQYTKDKAQHRCPTALQYESRRPCNRIVI
ncbi:haloacid dehalogenase-like hydrolase [Ponticoccus sp. SC2-23]|uniref:haloacid dehalogenase-like hydrolase n=1 Tax=Alexandriicola marinus TaxID=2081710 RepID=UPI000FD8F86F|nr:haloacid dehalogenase-like hydrolase [Alexandriicola marinus]MBM1222824.1 haloacid dehalogenase-like hydrolase [Ponticoccus sp. SC6-9]MBM1227206.1 haloacid dehalogenase-like hydrolase [Ponticoccus sp. SC6-15]MBM1231750.1 haloacid dehalogenase-like hydrolase [Ponticoccus sp. SC6-38]MBM1236323.1 haloacid dehalogenase-like hydrolase [Ponticoccus sp. SC6-45]MBM1240773.1 haloacid dehalogenase-like hydrolase [Ponticoccus sp. SC6-49]MBM1245308.1 haloacid dehalogenase-like hydrolase [Ponticoccus s